MKYVYGKKMKTLKDRLTTGLASLVILVNSAGMSLPFLLTQRAAAATAIVTPIDMQGWVNEDMRNDGQNTISSSRPDANGGNGSLQQSFSNSEGKAGLRKLADYGPLSTITDLSFDWYRDATSTAPSHLTPAFGILVADDVGNSWLLKWEGVYNGYTSSAPVNTWTTEDLLAGNFWRIPQTVSGSWVGFSGCNQAGDPYGCYTFNRTLNDTWLSGFNVVGLDVSIGSGWSGSYTSFVDNITINDTLYDFETIAPAPEITYLIAGINNASNYKGISVSTGTNSISDAKAISVTIKRADNSIVVKNSRPAPSGSVNGVNSGEVTTPFVIHHGTYDEAGSGSWYPAPASWTYATKPVEVTVVITLGDDTTVEKTVPVSISQAEYQSLVVTPSTNDINKTKGWAHVNEISKNVGSVELEFVSTRNFASCFEYRTDGDISQALATPNLNTDIADHYPAFCLNNETQAHTINANEYVEVRMVYGAEKDERFDWTRFDVLPDTTKPTISINPDVPQFISGTTEIEVTITDDQPLDASKNKQIWVEVYGRYDQTKKKGQKVDLSSGTGIFSLNTTTLPDGEYTLRVGSVADAAGNTSGDKTFKYFTIDNAGPNVFSATINGEDAAVAARTANCGPTDFNLVSGAINLGAIINDGTGVGTEGASYRIVRVNAGGCIMSNPAVNYGGGVYGYKSGNFAMTNTSGDEWTGPEFDTTTLPQDGSYTIEITTRDSLDNEAKRYVDILVDNTAPNAPTNLHRVLADNTIVPCGASIPRQALTPTWTLSSSDDVAHYEYSSFNKNGVPGLVQKNIGNTDHYNTGGWVPPQDGTGFKFAIRAVDHAGNKSAWAECGITYDSVAPDAPVLSLHTSPGGDIILDGGLTNSYGVVASWTVGPDDIGYEYRYFNSIPGDAYNAPAYYTTQPTVPSQSGVFNRGEGLHHLQVRAVDAAGNWSDWSEVFDVTYDTTAPTQPQILGFYKNNDKNQPIIPCGGYTNSTKILIDWEDNSEDDIAYYWFGTKFNPYHKKVSVSEYKGSMTPGNNPYFYTVIAVDHAGNESQISDQCYLTLDQTAPGKPDISIWQNGSDVTGGTVSDRNINVEWTAPSADVDYYEYQAAGSGSWTQANPWETTVNGTNRSGSIAGSDGDRYYRVRAVDHAGNLGEWSDWVKITLDTTVPAAITSPSVDNEAFGFPSTIVLGAHDQSAANGNVQWAVRAGTCAANTNTLYGNVDGHNDSSTWVDGYFSANVDGLELGDYCFVFNTGINRLTRTFSITDPLGLSTDQPSKTDVNNTGNNNLTGGRGQGEADSSNGAGTNNARGVLGESTGLSNTGSSVSIFAAVAGAIFGAALWIVRRKSAAN